jgi:hypothetical protein
MPKAVRNSVLEKRGGRARAPVGVKDMPSNLTDNAPPERQRVKKFPLALLSPDIAIDR